MNNSLFSDDFLEKDWLYDFIIEANNVFVDIIIFMTEKLFSNMVEKYFALSNISEINDENQIIFLFEIIKSFDDYGGFSIESKQNFAVAVLYCYYQLVLIESQYDDLLPIGMINHNTKHTREVIYFSNNIIVSDELKYSFIRRKLLSFNVETTV